MTKKRKIERLASRLNIDKKEATDLLRRAKWDPSLAEDLYHYRDIDIDQIVKLLNSIDFKKIYDDAADAIYKFGMSVKKCSDNLIELLNKRR